MRGCGWGKEAAGATPLPRPPVRDSYLHGPVPVHIPEPLTSRFELVLGRGQPGLSLPGQGQGPSCSSCLSGEDPGTPETGQIGGVLEPHTGLGLDTCSGRTGRTQSRHHWLFHLTLGIQHALTHHKVLTHTSHTSYIPQSPHSTYHTHMLTHNTKTLHKEPER